MEVVDLATPWIAEDDVLLKNAIETGASLEALAKGAVRFSRRFTIRELQDRWYSLLYHPCESVRASIRISEVENLNGGHTSKLCKIGSIKESSEKNIKRKTESIRRKYYATRKKIRAQLIDDNGIGFYGAPSVNGHVDQGLHDYQLRVDPMAPDDNYLLGDHIMANSGLLEFGQETVGRLKPVEENDRLKSDSGIMKMPPKYDTMYNDAGDGCPELGEQGHHFFNSPISDSLAHLPSVELSSPTCRESFWKITEDVFVPVLSISTYTQDITEDEEIGPNILDGDHDRLMNSAKENGLLCMDADGSASVDKSSHDNVNSLLVSSPIYSNVGFVPIGSSSVTKDAVTTHALSITTSPTTLDISRNPLESGISNKSNVCLEPRISSSVEKSHCSDIRDTDTPCTLNTEVEEVPNNDDIFPIGVVAATQKLSQKPSETAPMNGCPNDIKNLSQPIVVLGAKPVQLLASTVSTQPSIQTGFSTASTLVGKHAKNSQLVPDNQKASRFTGAGAVREVEGKASIAELKKLEASDMKFEELVLPEQISEPLPPGEEKLESDDDIPYFSDVEAMVLEMDLCTNDQDPFTCARVSQYQDVVTMKQIVRLEQCARSYMDRRIESHGALAILYGRRLKFYIKKPEVILGRATEDMEVDVDLAREGRANKISRQQASIKLEADGSFSIKNLGKFNISVNGIDLATEQFVTFGISNLIEIRGMSFIFEANQKSVHRFRTSGRQVSRSLACKEDNRRTVGVSNRCHTSKHLKV